VRGKILARSGRFEDGVAMAREAVRLAHTSDDPTAQGNALADLAEVFMLGGQASEATTALDAAMARFDSKGNLAAAAEARHRIAKVSAERGEVQPRGIGRIG